MKFTIDLARNSEVLVTHHYNGSTSVYIDNDDTEQQLFWDLGAVKKDKYDVAINLLEQAREENDCKADVISSLKSAILRKDAEYSELEKKYCGLVDLVEYPVEDALEKEVNTSRLCPSNEFAIDQGQCTGDSRIDSLQKDVAWLFGTIEEMSKNKDGFTCTDVSPNSEWEVTPTPENLQLKD